jgi:Protein of unknown function (DUF732)
MVIDWKKTATWIAVVVLAVLAAWAASGPIADVRFVSTLMAHDIPGDRFAEIGAAHQLCDGWRRGHAGDPQWAGELMGASISLRGQGLGVDQMQQFVADTESAFCPGVNPR